MKSDPCQLVGRVIFALLFWIMLPEELRRGSLSNQMTIEKELPRFTLLNIPHSLIPRSYGISGVKYEGETYTG